MESEEKQEKPKGRKITYTCAKCGTKRSSPANGCIVCGAKQVKVIFGDVRKTFADDDRKAEAT